HAHHGLVCGLLLPSVLRYNRPVAGERLARLAEDCALDRPTADRFIERVEEVRRNVGLDAGLDSIGRSREQVAAVARDPMPAGTVSASTGTQLRSYGSGHPMRRSERSAST